MADYRLMRAARADIASILAWSQQQFGADVRKRYESLIATLIRDAAARNDDRGPALRPELDDGAFSWYLACSRLRAPEGKVHRPRHFLI